MKAKLPAKIKRRLNASIKPKLVPVMSNERRFADFVCIQFKSLCTLKVVVLFVKYKRKEENTLEKI